MDDTADIIGLFEREEGTEIRLSFKLRIVDSKYNCKNTEQEGLE